MPINFMKLSEDCFKGKDDPWRQSIVVGPNRLLTITDNDHVIFTYLCKDPSNQTLYSDSELITPGSKFYRTWFSLLLD